MVYTYGLHTRNLEGHTSSFQGRRTVRYGLQVEEKGRGGFLREPARLLLLPQSLGGPALCMLDGARLEIVLASLDGDLRRSLSA